MGKPGNMGMALGAFLRDSSDWHADRAALVCFPLHEALRWELGNIAHLRGRHLGISLRRVRTSAPRSLAKTVAGLSGLIVIREQATFGRFISARNS
jgi:hypothetical protein